MEPIRIYQTVSERLSGKYLNGSDRAFLGSAEGRKLLHFAPSFGLLGPRNGARSEFPDSLRTVILGNWASGVPIPGDYGMKLRLSEVAESARLEPL
jgi:hypothetical protein